jgi:hypothetical protein
MPKTTRLTAETLERHAAEWARLAKLPNNERGPFTKRFCVFKAAQLQLRAKELRGDSQ